MSPGSSSGRPVSLQTALAARWMGTPPGLCNNRRASSVLVHLAIEVQAALRPASGVAGWRVVTAIQKLAGGPRHRRVRRWGGYGAAGRWPGSWSGQSGASWSPRAPAEAWSSGRPGFGCAISPRSARLPGRHPLLGPPGRAQASCTVTGSGTCRLSSGFRQPEVMIASPGEHRTEAERLLAIVRRSRRRCALPGRCGSACRLLLAGAGPRHPGPDPQITVCSLLASGRRRTKPAACFSRVCVRSWPHGLRSPRPSLSRLRRGIPRAHRPRRPGVPHCALLERNRTPKASLWALIAWAFEGQVLPTATNAMPRRGRASLSLPKTWQRAAGRFPHNNPKENPMAAGDTQITITGNMRCITKAAARSGPCRKALHPGASWAWGEKMASGVF